MVWITDNETRQDKRQKHQIRVIFILCTFITLWLIQVFAMNLINIQMEVEFEAVIDGNTTIENPLFDYTIEHLDISGKVKLPVYVYDSSKLRFWE